MTDLWWKVKVWWWALTGYYRRFDGLEVGDVLDYLADFEDLDWYHAELEVRIRNDLPDHLSWRPVSGASTVRFLRERLRNWGRHVEVRGTVRIM